MCGLYILRASWPSTVEAQCLRKINKKKQSEDNFKFEFMQNAANGHKGTFNANRVVIRGDWRYLTGY